MTGRNHTVLLVDDDPDIREIVTLVLRLNNLSVVTASDGVEALELLRGAPEIGLVLLDLMMPRMDGGELLRALKGDPMLAATPVVVMSGNRNAAAMATKLGADACLSKPIEIDDLTGIVTRFATAETT
jgi:CheY-like chemotaxis protein